MNRRSFLLRSAWASALASSGSRAIAGTRIDTRSTSDDSSLLRLTATQPARVEHILQEGFPIGNGHFGALIGGSPAQTCLVLSEASLWLGTENTTLGMDGQFPYKRANFGSFELLARLRIELPGHDADAIEDYRRSLDLANGCVETSYRFRGTDYRQRIYASHPDDVVVVEIAAGAGAILNGAIWLEGTHGEACQVSGHRVQLAGALANGLRYASVAGISAESGAIHTASDGLRFSGVRALTLCIAGATNHAPDAADGFRNPRIDPSSQVAAVVERALAKGAPTLQAAHRKDYSQLFGAMSLDLGRSTRQQRALDVAGRLDLRCTPDAQPDPELEALYFQFGRYLTIAGSRGVVPAGLQGLWLIANDPPWRADYHTDINIQMNYWLPDRANLPSCFDALTDYCVGQYPSWEHVTQSLFNDPKNKFRNSSGRIAGWTAAMSLNIDGGLGWWWQPASNAWLCNTLYEHYEYRHDRDHLARIYPMMKSACAFWEARLIEVKVEGRIGEPPRSVLVDDHDWSPEQGPDDTRGITYAQELVWALFDNYRRAAATLGRDPGYVATISALQDRLYLPVIAPATGALEEWMSADDLGSPAHRHLSPLVGLFPGDRIRPDDGDPALVAATRRRLELRGTDHQGWGNAWRACCWARLKDGEKAYQLVLGNLAPIAGRKAGTAANLLNTSVLPPHSGAYENETGGHSLDTISPGEGELIFQIDANLGTPAAIAEMLLYSRPGRIEILPALPAAWAKEGAVTNLPARGGFILDIAWRAGKATKVAIESIGGTTTNLVVDGRTVPIALRRSERRQIV